LTGEIKLDKDPGAEFRSNIILDLMEKNGDRMSKTGTWTYESGVNYTKSESARQEETTQKLENKTLQVVTTLVNKAHFICNLYSNIIVYYTHSYEL
jgi:hypothetical protein